MALPTGLLPAFAFVLTVGLAAPTALGAHLYHRGGHAPFAAGLRAAFVEAGALYLVGVGVVWAVAGGGPLWGTPAALVAAGLAALLGPGALPLAVGRRLVQRAGANPDAALRYATYGWPVASLAVFGQFVAPGGLARGTLFTLGGERVCLAGFCGVAVSLLAAVLAELLVALLGPGVVGAAAYATAAEPGR